MHSSVQRLMNEVLVELPGCPRPLVAIMLRDTVRDFLDRTQILAADLDAIDIVAGTYRYTLTVPVANEGYRINRPTLVVLNDEEQRAGIDWHMQDRTTLQLRDVPQTAIEDGLEVTVALTLDDIQTADTSALEDWEAVLVAGAKATLMILPRKPWTSQQTAGYYRNEYNTGLSRAMSYVATSGLNSPVRLGA